MYDILLTSLILLFLLFATLWQSRRGDERNFFSKDYTNILKGACAIVVLLVHVEPSYQNPLQDGVGSFAYVAVTLFFFISAYGMQLSVERKPGYLKHFWRNRLVSLLIPCLLINLFAFVYQIEILNNKSLAVLVEINGYVKVLLQYCLLFYCVMMLSKWLKVEKTWITDGLLIAGVVGSSLYLYFSEGGDGANVSGWCYERYGLVWGLLLYRFFSSGFKLVQCATVCENFSLFASQYSLGTALSEVQKRLVLWRVSVEGASWYIYYYFFVFDLSKKNFWQ